MIPVKNRLLTYIIIIMFAYISASSMHMIFMGETMANNYNLYVTYLIFCGICCFYSILNINRNIFNGFTISILLYIVYFIIRCLFDDKMLLSNATLSNCMWVIFAFTGFILGYTNRMSNYRLISLIFIIFSSFFILPIIYRSLLSGIIYSIDGFFICLFIFPLIFLLKHTFLKGLFLILFIILGIISGKRTIVILMILSLVIFLFQNIKENPKKSIIGLSIAMILLFLNKNNPYLVHAFNRIMHISEDGGSGRIRIYQTVWKSFDSFSSQDILFGKGRFSVMELCNVDAHMDFLQILHSLGILGLLLYCLIYFKAFKLVLRQRKLFDDEAKQLYRISLITILTTLFSAYSNCLIFNPLIISPAIFIFCYVLGIVHGYQKNAQVRKII